MSNNEKPRILISRMSAIGDTILTLPVACAIRAQYPDAYLGWVVEKKAAPMVRGHQALDVVIELERGWFTSVKGIRNAKRTLKSHEFELSIDCQGNTKSALACYLSGAKQRVGYRGKHGCELSTIFNNDKIQPVFSHLTDRSLELLTPLEINSPKVEWKLPLPAAARQWAAGWRRSISYPKLAVLNPGGTWDSKLWEADRFAKTAHYLKNRYGYACTVVWGTDAERTMAEEIVAGSGGSCTLAPSTDLYHLAALIESADLFISGDTGPLHMAVAVGAKTIGLYGATRPGDCGPYQQVALQNAYEGGSRKQRRRADNSAMRAISVQDVCQAIDKLEAERLAEAA